MNQPKTFSAVVEIDAFNLASDWSDEDAAEFVKELAEAMASWDFTLKMYEFFAAQKEEHDAAERLTNEVG